MDAIVCAQLCWTWGAKVGRRGSPKQKNKKVNTYRSSERDDASPREFRSA